MINRTIAASAHSFYILGRVIQKKLKVNSRARDI